ncbi:MAG TPA: co-chaperone YbbN [Azospirillaceae bacterium]|nr:co-chaperone YbbN [Azospirillaceae bacterium]
MFSFGQPKKPAPGPAGLGAAAGAAPGTADVVMDSSDRAFMADVIEASMKTPVIVDFWAPWCGPCKQLGPILEKTVRAAKGKVRMVKIDTDKNPMIASQLRVQSIPAVYAFFQGRPVDGFVGGQSESQVKAFVDRLIQAAGAAGGGADDSLEAALEQAKALLEGDQPAAAADIYAQILEVDQECAPAYAGMVKALIAAEQFDDAKGMLGGVPAAIAKDKEIVAAKAALDVALQAQNAGPIPELMEKLAQDKNDHQTRFDLAMALFAAGKREAAVDELLEIVRRDRTWNDDGARKQLVKFFEAFGHMDPLTVATRKRLSTILFS